MRPIPTYMKPRMRPVRGGWRIDGGGYVNSARLPWQAYFQWLRHAPRPWAARHRAYAELSGKNG